MKPIGPTDLEKALHDSLLERLRALQNSGVAVGPSDDAMPPLRGSCRVCGDTGYVAGLSVMGSRSAVDCRACSIARDRRHLRLLSASRVPPAFAGVPLDGILATTVQAQRAVALSTIWAHLLDDGWPIVSPFLNPALGSILIVGPVGSVKSTLAGALFAYRLALPHTSSGVWFKVYDLCQEIRRSWDKEAGAPTTTELLDRVRESDILVLDDLGVEEPYPWVLEYLHSIIDYRADFFRPTIFTSNLELAELEARLGRRIVSRIEGMVAPYIVHMSQPDMRRPGARP